jgi:hypothetical protein
MKKVPKVDVDAIINSPNLPEEIQDREKWPKIYNYTLIDNKFLSELQENAYRIVTAYSRRYKNQKNIERLMERPPLLITYIEDQIALVDSLNPEPEFPIILRITRSWVYCREQKPKSSLRAILSAFSLNGYESRRVVQTILDGLIGIQSYREECNLRLLGSSAENVTINLTQRELKPKQRKKFRDLNANRSRKEQIINWRNQIENHKKYIRDCEQQIQNTEKQIVDTPVPDIKELLR